MELSGIIDIFFFLIFRYELCFFKEVLDMLLFFMSLLYICCMGMVCQKCNYSLFFDAERKDEITFIHDIFKEINISEKI